MESQQQQNSNQNQNFTNQFPSPPPPPPSEILDSMNSNGHTIKPQNQIPTSIGTHSGTDKDNSGGEEETTSRRKRRKSRWDPPPPPTKSSETTTSTAAIVNGEPEAAPKKRKSRWADDPPAAAGPLVPLPDFMKEFTDPEVQVLNLRLAEINSLLSSGGSLDNRPEGARSPSPEPIYDNVGVRINTREYRARERLNKERVDIISQLLKKNPHFQPPSGYRPPKVQKRLYIPEKDYPGYNFIGLIIGPRGNTQKRMEKETGAKIVIRGRGAVKEGRLRNLKPDPCENEDTHVLVEAETQEAVDAAANMVEKLLQPLDEVLNEHKRQQLKELAEINGTVRVDEYCRLCGEKGHRQLACPSRLTTFKSDVLCKVCGDGGHPTIDCPMKTSTGKKMEDEYMNFLAELGGNVPDSSAKQISAVPTLGSGSTPPWKSNNNTGGIGSANQAGQSMAKLGKEYDETNLYIGYLPPTLEDDELIRLFSSFGDIAMAKVIKDRMTGLSKGYGFVKYSEASQANQAIATMNGYRLDGRPIAVRVAGKPTQPALPPGPPLQALPTYAVTGGYPSQQLPPGAPFLSVPPAGYIGNPYPWGPPVPSPYAGYATLPPPPPPPPPPPGSVTYPPAYGHPMPHYNILYPQPIQTNPPGVPSQSSEAQQNLPPGVQPADLTSSQSMPINIDGSSLSDVPQTSQSTDGTTSSQSLLSNINDNSVPTVSPNLPPTYPPSSFAYPSYYSVPPIPLPIMSHSPMTATPPWISTQPAPPPTSSAKETTEIADSKKSGIETE